MPSEFSEDYRALLYCAWF